MAETPPRAADGEPGDHREGWEMTVIMGPELTTRTACNALSLRVDCTVWYVGSLVSLNVSLDLARRWRLLAEK